MSRSYWNESEEEYSSGKRVGYTTGRTLLNEEHTLEQEQEVKEESEGEEPAFKLHNKEAIEKRLEQLRADPTLIQQAKGPVCSMAAISYVWMKVDFEGFRKVVLDLYEKGEASYNGYDIEPDDHLMEVDPKGDKYPYSGYKGNYSADWIILSCLADNLNTFYDYDGEGNDETGGAQTMGDYRNLANKLFGNSYNVSKYVEYKHTSAADVKALFQSFENISNADGYVVMGMDASMVKSSLQSGGGHAVTYIKGTLKFSIIDGKEYMEFKVQTWGEKGGRTVKVTLEEANKKFNRYFTVEKKNG